MRSMFKAFIRRDFGYSPLHRAFEITAILSFFVIVALISFRAYHGLADLGWATTAWLIPVTAILGYVGADFASGMVHWLGDTYGDKNTPIVGERFVKPFRDHHTHPLGIVEHDYVQVNGNNSIVLAMYMVPIGLIFSDPTSQLHLVVLCFSVFFTMGVFMTNQFHKWAHMDDAPAYILFLQRIGLILGKEHHDVHHTSPHDTYYCITCGWMNPILQKLRFFETLESVLRRVAGLRTSRERAEVEATR
jgi:plasmanylethanolamine desaturase